MYLCDVVYKNNENEILSAVITDDKWEEEIESDPMIIFKERPIALVIIEAIIKGEKDFNCNGVDYTLEKVIKNEPFDKMIEMQQQSNPSRRLVDFTKEKGIQRIKIYKSKYKCLRCLRYGSEMNIESVTAKIYTISGGIAYLDMAYCKNCKQYFTDQSTIGFCENKNGPLAVEKCEDFDRDIIYKKDSVLSRYGYKADGSMSDNERRICIAFIIENGLAKKHEIINHLLYLIDDRGFRCLNARERWESDLAFVHNYDKMRQKYVGEVIILNKDFYLVEE